MKALKFVLAAVGASALAASPSLAADPVPMQAPVMIVVPPAAPPATLAGYVEVFAGYARGRDFDDGGELEGTVRLFGFGGAGRVAWQPRPALGLQLDAWAEHWSGRNLCDGEPCNEPFADDIMGIAAHLWTRIGTASRVGVVASVGTWDGGTLANVGGEATYGTAGFRVVVQGGYTFPIAGWPVGDAIRDFYGIVFATLYPRPNLAITANVGLDLFQANCCAYSEIALRWGTRAEFQVGGGPLSVFAAYQGYRGAENDGDVNWTHVFGVGVALSFGEGGLRARDGLVGLGDYNAIYGATFPH